MTPISFSVMNNLSSDTLRTIQHELVVKIEACQAEGVRPTWGVADAVKRINDTLSKRGE